MHSTWVCLILFVLTIDVKLNAIKPLKDANGYYCCYSKSARIIRLINNTTAPVKFVYRIFSTHFIICDDTNRECFFLVSAGVANTFLLYNCARRVINNIRLNGYLCDGFSVASSSNCEFVFHFSLLVTPTNFNFVLKDQSRKYTLFISQWLICFLFKIQPKKTFASKTICLKRVSELEWRRDVHTCKRS